MRLHLSILACGLLALTQAASIHENTTKPPQVEGLKEDSLFNVVSRSTREESRCTKEKEETLCSPGQSSHTQNLGRTFDLLFKGKDGKSQVSTPTSMNSSQSSSTDHCLPTKPRPRPTSSLPSSTKRTRGSRSIRDSVPKFEGRNLSLKRIKSRSLARSKEHIIWSSSITFQKMMMRTGTARKKRASG